MMPLLQASAEKQAAERHCVDITELTQACSWRAWWLECHLWTTIATFPVFNDGDVPPDEYELDVEAFRAAFSEEEAILLRLKAKDVQARKDSNDNVNYQLTTVDPAQCQQPTVLLRLNLKANSLETYFDRIAKGVGSKTWFKPPA